MSTSYPGSVDDNTTLPNPSASSLVLNPDHAGLHSNANDAIKAVEEKLGTGTSQQSPEADKILVGDGSGSSSWSKDAPQGDIVGTDDAQTLENKTLEAPTINDGQISNPNLSVDTIAEYTNDNGVEVDGLLIKDGEIEGTSIKEGTLPPTAMNNAWGPVMGVIPAGTFGSTGNKTINIGTDWTPSVIDFDILVTSSGTIASSGRGSMDMFGNQFATFSAVSSTDGAASRNSSTDICMLTLAASGATPLMQARYVGVGAGQFTIEVMNSSAAFPVIYRAYP